MSLVNSVLNMVGFHLAPAVEDSSKPHLEPGTEPLTPEPLTPEQEFGEMTFSDNDSDENANFCPAKQRRATSLCFLKKIWIWKMLPPRTDLRSELEEGTLPLSPFQLSPKRSLI